MEIIVDLSHPPGTNINDIIPKELCSLNCISVDTAMQHILSNLVQAHSSQSCLLFGLCSTPKLYNVLADLLTWILQQRGVSPIIHYLDNFLTVGPALSDKCQENLSTIQHICSDLGISLAKEKLEGPTHCLTFLGIEIDTHQPVANLSGLNPSYPVG